MTEESCVACFHTLSNVKHKKMKHLFKSISLLLCAFILVGTNALAQENQDEKSRIDLSVSLGQGFLANSTTGLMHGYTPVHDGLMSGAFYLGWTATKRENAMGVAFRILTPSPGYSIDAFGKENTLNHTFYVAALYNRTAIPIRAVENLNFIYSIEVGAVWLNRAEQIYNSTSQDWDKHSRTRVGIEAAIGLHLQYQISKHAYLMAGTNLTGYIFYKKINDYQQNDKTQIGLIDTSIGVGLNF